MEFEKRLTSVSRQKLAAFIGGAGLGLSASLACVYYAHIITLTNPSIDVLYYIASTHSIATTFFTLSFSLGLIALLNYKHDLSSNLMLVSTLTAFVGYIPPSVRLWKLGYTGSLYETIVIAVVHIALLATSTTVFKKVNHEIKFKSSE